MWLTDTEGKMSLTKYLMQKGDIIEGTQDRPRLKIRDRDNSFLENYIQKLNVTELECLLESAFKNESQHNLKDNFLFFRKELQKSFESQNAEKPDENLSKFAKFLALYCTLVVVSTTTRQDAIRIFSIMNTTGLDLQNTDILKADIIDKLPEQDQTRYSDTWEDLETRLGRAKFDSLFAHIRMIHKKQKAQKTLIEEFNEAIINESSFNPALFITNELSPYTDHFDTLTRCNYSVRSAPHNLGSAPHNINSYFKCLNRLDYSDWIPPALKWLKDYDDNPKDTEEFFKNLERLAAFMHVCAFDINRRINRYSQVLGQTGKQKFMDAVNLLDDEKNRMKDALNGNVYELTPKRRNYIILRLDSFVVAEGASYEGGTLTIEHVLPQTVQPRSQWEQWWPDPDQRKEWLHRIANLVPLPRSINSAARNYDFNDKLNKYFTRTEVPPYRLTAQVLKEKDWKPDTVKARQNSLMGIFIKNWDL